MRSVQFVSPFCRHDPIRFEFEATTTNAVSEENNIFNGNGDTKQLRYLGKEKRKNPKTLFAAEEEEIENFFDGSSNLTRSHSI